MIEPDTIKLLRECNAGIKMGTASIADVLDKVNDTKLKEMLENCKDQHQDLQKELESLLSSQPATVRVQVRCSRLQPRTSTT